MSKFVSSWNIAAINNNPFEYWITYHNQDYNKLMDDVQETFLNPSSEMDVNVSSVFTNEMFKDLEDYLAKSDYQNQIEEIRSIWKNDYSTRKIVSEFLTDSALGRKRILSMPDRTTNTFINNGDTHYRPTAINCYSNNFDNLADFWTKWLDFMFVSPQAASRILQIKKSKYPAITEKEEELSKPLSILGLAIFDTALVNILNKLNPGWQTIRSNICLQLNQNKLTRVIDILDTKYQDSAIIFLQEVGLSLKSALKSSRREIVFPESSKKSKRDQNSAILLDVDKFDLSTVVEISEKVEKKLVNAPIASGDLLVIEVLDKQKKKYCLGSFHGDTNGLATIPILKAILAVADPKAALILGFDANSHFGEAGDKKLSLKELFKVLKKEGLATNYKAPFDSGNENNYTCYNGRTFLQPQLNKAIGRREIATKGDVNQKDFIIFRAEQFESEGFLKDNTGERKFLKDTVFPTLQFPSDHAIISCQLISLEKKINKSEL